MGCDSLAIQLACWPPTVLVNVLILVRPGMAGEGHLLRYDPRCPSQSSQGMTTSTFTTTFFNSSRCLKSSTRTNDATHHHHHSINTQPLRCTRTVVLNNVHEYEYCTVKYCTPNSRATTTT
eukprot:scaffold164861_cov19-Prasinocladus_malaysianus.AAC.1